MEQRQGFKNTRFLKPSPAGFWVLSVSLGTEFYWVSGGVLKYEWKVVNVIHSK